jgi:hypothetical protein
MESFLVLGLLEDDVFWGFVYSYELFTSFGLRVV